MGQNPKNRMPLWIKPDRQLSLQDVFDMMRDQYQGTPMDMTKDVGGGPFYSGVRWRPMRWDLNGQTYIHERAISTQQTGFSFISQSRGWLPNPIGGILWFGVDDSYTTVWTPMYCAITEVPHAFEVGNGHLLEYSNTSAFWLFNLVAHLAYSRYSDMIVDIKEVQKELESGFMRRVAENDVAWKNLSHDQQVRETTRFSLAQGQRMFNEWKKLQEYLLVKYLDGNIKREVEINGRRQFEAAPYSVPGIPISPLQPRYPDWFYQQIVDQIGNNIKYIRY
jgi:dipeptidase